MLWDNITIGSRVRCGVSRRRHPPALLNDAVSVEQGVMHYSVRTADPEIGTFPCELLQRAVVGGVSPITIWGWSTPSSLDTTCWSNQVQTEWE